MKINKKKIEHKTSVLNKIRVIENKCNELRLELFKEITDDMPNDLFKSIKYFSLNNIYFIDDHLDFSIEIEVDEFVYFRLFDKDHVLLDNGSIEDFDIFEDLNYFYFSIIENRFCNIIILNKNYDKEITEKLEKYIIGKEVF